MAEQFANLAQTQTTAQVNGSATTLALANGASPFPSQAQFRVRVEDLTPGSGVNVELMLVTAGAGTNSWTVTRGIEGTSAVAHAAGSAVTHVVTAGALAGLEQAANKGVAGGYAGLDSGGLLTSAQRPQTSGLLANRPSVATAGDKGTYFATDDNGGTLYQVQSGAWVLVAPRGAELGYAQLGGNAGNVTTTSFASLDNSLTVTVTVRGRPIMVQTFVPQLINQLTTIAVVTVGIFQDGVELTEAPTTVPANQFQGPSLFVSGRANPAAGTHTYDLRGKVGGAGQTITPIGGATRPIYIQVVEI